MRIARRVTYGTLSMLLAAGVAQVDFWPLSAYKLFSGVRTDTVTSTRLVATLDDGREAAVGRGADPVLGPTQNFLPELHDAGPATRQVMLTTWLEQAGLDPAEVRHLRTERVRRVVDPATLAWSETVLDVRWTDALAVEGEL
ncbi:hypothetical protein [Promicromonospora iranensis]|uniref:Uncharacterized protein n=1 Tax=Promicromonospora iranensis TaxID=1105144 RepID=A0ABU2CSK7_9MICO|nr:hypothetical protein [Promicromonospora iranensis]MDR7384320.1 hypothetical protein [Promicromonospora iranensis]